MGLELISAFRRGVAGVVVAAIAGCAAPPSDGTLIADPYEGFNRRVHSINKSADQAVWRPASNVFSSYTPALVRFLVHNGVSNLELPVDAANQILQGRLEDALSTAGRFGLNTVFGAAGLLDPATSIGLPRQRTDFGETLHVWGVREGAYVELPFFGPSTERDAFGQLVDYLMNPTTYFTGYVLESPATEVILGMRGTEALLQRAERAEFIDSILYGSGDSYTELKNAYVQYRRRQLGMETRPEDALPDIFDDPAETGPENPPAPVD